MASLEIILWAPLRIEPNVSFFPFFPAAAYRWISNRNETYWFWIMWGLFVRVHRHSRQLFKLVPQKRSESAETTPIRFLPVRWEKYCARWEHVVVILLIYHCFKNMDHWFARDSDIIGINQLVCAGSWFADHNEWPGQSLSFRTSTISLDRNVSPRSSKFIILFKCT